MGRNTIWVIAKDMPGPLIRRHFGRILSAQCRVTRDALPRVARRSGARPAARATGGRARPAALLAPQVQSAKASIEAMMRCWSIPRTQMTRLSRLAI